MATAPIGSGGGYILSAPGFHPPQTNADEGAISSASEKFFSLAGRITGRGDNLLATIYSGATEYSELVSEPIRTQGGYNAAASKKGAEGAIYGGQISGEWATDVLAYKQTIAGLVEEYTAMAATKFGPDATELDNLIGMKLTSGLMRRANAVYEGFKDQAAVRGKQLTDGPTKAHLKELAQGGDMAWFSPALFASTGTGPTEAIDRLVKQGLLPQSMRFMDADQAQEYILAHPELAVGLRKLAPDPNSTDPDERALAALLVPIMGASGTGTPLMIRSRAAFEKMSLEKRKWMALLYPETVGNLDGAPFEERAIANSIRVAGEMQLEGAKAHPDAGRMALYDSIVNNDRKIIYFDPRGDGAIAELHGPLTSSTKNVGILVPGTGTDLSNYDSFAERSRSFQAANGKGDLAMITWMGGDEPNSVSKDAPFNHYAKTMAPELAMFSHETRLEMNSVGATSGKITVAGHSYGGSIVGLSEKYSLDADRVMHIESAGAGPGIQTPDEYHNTNNPNVRRYSMTAPGDPIGVTQGADLTDIPRSSNVKLDDIGHGADPDRLKGVTRLYTGNYADGSLVEGKDAHGRVFESGSDSWKNMYGVFTGGEVTSPVEHHEHGHDVPPGQKPPRYTVDDIKPDTPSEKIDIP